MEIDKELKEIERLVVRLEHKKEDRLSDYDMEQLEKKIEELKLKFSKSKVSVEQLESLEIAQEKQLEINELIRDTFGVIDKFDREKKTETEAEDLILRIDIVKGEIKSKYPSLSDAQISEYKVGDFTLGTLLDRLDDMVSESELSNRVKEDSHAFDGFMSELKGYKESVDKVIYGLEEKKFSEELKDALKPEEEIELFLVEVQEQDYLGRMTKKSVVMSQKEYDLTQEKGFPYEKPYLRSGGRDYDDSFVRYVRKEPESLKELNMLKMEIAKREELKKKAQEDPEYGVEGVITIAKHEVAGVKLSDLILAGINPENVKFMTMEQKRKKDAAEKVSSSSIARAAKGYMSGIIKRIGNALHRREPIAEKAKEQKVDIEELIEEIGKDLDRRPLVFWTERVETLNKSLEGYPQVATDFPDSIDDLKREELLKLLDARRKSINLIDNKKKNIDFLTSDLDSVNKKREETEVVLEEITKQYPSLTREDALGYVQKGKKRSLGQILSEVEQNVQGAQYDKDRVKDVLGRLDSDRKRLEEEKQRLDSKIAVLDKKEFEDDFRKMLLAKESPLVMARTIDDDDGRISTSTRIMTAKEFEFAAKYETILPKPYFFSNKMYDRSLRNEVVKDLSGDEQMQLMEAEERRKKLKEEFLANPNNPKYTVKGKIKLDSYEIDGREYKDIEIGGVTRGELIAVGIDPESLGFEEQREEVR